MRIEPRHALPQLVLMLALGLGACSTRMYQRETVVLDHRDLDSFQIRYEDFDACLWRRSVPVSYRVQRAQYALQLDVRFGSDADPARIDLALSGAGVLDARFSGLTTPPQKTLAESGQRFLIPATTVQDGRFTVSVFIGGALTGEETVQVRREHCRALGLGEKP